jgi:hypothetical protein
MYSHVATIRMNHVANISLPRWKVCWDQLHNFLRRLPLLSNRSLMSIRTERTEPPPMLSRDHMYAGSEQYIPQRIATSIFNQSNPAFGERHHVVGVIRFRGDRAGTASHRTLIPHPGPVCRVFCAMEEDPLELEAQMDAGTHLNDVSAARYADSPHLSGRRLTTSLLS